MNQYDIEWAITKSFNFLTGSTVESSGRNNPIAPNTLLGFIS